MTRSRPTTCIALLLVAACSGGSSSAPAVAPSHAAAPVATRGYRPVPANVVRREVPVAAPRAAEPLDPAEVLADQPENVQVHQ
jgi:hypothetical protein